jgi:cellulose synthase/poly-beta-1,6-N-acetylglucosamine synthase-like glycosyltransferase
MIQVYLYLSVAIILMLVYPYLIYPLLLWCISSSKSTAKIIIDRDSLPRISLILSVYNEEDVIEAKIDNFLALDYPSDKIEFLIVSDGSNDKTDQLVTNKQQGSIKLIRQGREGKTAALNRAAEQSNADILVFTDANTFFASDAILKLVSPFNDSTVGLVSGLVLPSYSDNGERFFGRFEMYLKSRESALGFIAGADGAIYALRRGLYTPLAPSIINDFVHPIQAAMAGYRSVLAKEAIAYEESVDDPVREFYRQKRMVNQAFAIVRQMLPKLIMAGQLGLVWVLVSHKLLRWFHFPLMGLFVLCAILLFIKIGLSIFFWLAMLYINVGAFGVFFPGARKRMPVFDLLYKFQLVHLAFVFGIIESIQGRSAVVWNPRGGS